MICDYRTMGNTLDQHSAAIGKFMGRLRGPGSSKRSNMSKEQRTSTASPQLLD